MLERKVEIQNFRHRTVGRGRHAAKYEITTGPPHIASFFPLPRQFPPSTDVPRTSKLNESKVNVTTWHNLSESRISCRRSKLVKIISEPSATRYMAFEVIRSNIEVTLTPPWIDRLRSNLVQSFITWQCIHCKCSRLKVKVTGSKVKVTA